MFYIFIVFLIMIDRLGGFKCAKIRFFPLLRKGKVIKVTNRWIFGMQKGWFKA